MKIYALEITSECNLNCSYCPQPTMERKKEHMPLEMYQKALSYPFWYDMLVAHLFGEAFLHPELEKIVSYAHDKDLAFGFSSNMRDFSLEYFNHLRKKGLSFLVISYHIPEAQKWYKYLTKHYPEFPLIANELEQKHDWAGQVDKNIKGNIKKQVADTKPSETSDCIFHKFDLVTISAQGDIYACCLDAEGLSNQGSLFDYSPEEFSNMKNDIYFELCKLCPMTNKEQDLYHLEEQHSLYAEQISNYRKRNM